MQTSKYKNVMCIFFSIIITLVVLFVQMRIWEFDFNVLPATSGDSLINIVSLKSMKEFGFRGLWFNFRLGAPDVSALIDTPFLDIPMAVMGMVFVNIFSSEVIAFYVLYISAFVLSALTMSFLLNKITNSVIANLVFSSIFALLPYHFIRGMGHLTLTFYYVVPIGIYLGLLVYEDDFFRGIPVSWRKSFGSYFKLYILCLLVGISNVYYSYFSMLMVLSAIVIKAIEEKSMKVFFRRLSVFLFMIVGFLAGILPKIVYSFLHGKNLIAGVRQPLETEVFGLKIIQLFLPSIYTRVNFLKAIQEKYTTHGFNVNENVSSSLGVGGIIGIIILCIYLLIRCINPENPVIKLNMRLNLLAIWTLILILYCTTGGFGAIFSYIVTPELRALNRVSIVLDALALLTCVLIISKYKKYTIYILSIMLFAITVYVDVPQSVYSGSQDTMKAICNDYKDFFHEIESSMSKDAMIYELPMVDFPESAPVNNMEDYAQFKGYLFTDTLKWSYGGMKGRNNAAKNLNIDNGMSLTFIKGLIASKFSGVYIDTDAYEDGGLAINKFYQETLKLKPIISSDQKLYFYNILNIDETLLIN